MTKKTSLVYGVGINDADYVVSKKNKDGSRMICPFYETWKGVLNRCYSAKRHEKRPTYIGCSVVPDWHLFSKFREWMISQDWEGKQIDKDILVTGNKIYGPDTCVFVSKALNLFMTDRASYRGEWPIGVSWNKKSGKLRAYCNNPFVGKHEHLGFFTNQEEAHEAWRKRKHELACMYAEQQTDQRVAKALREAYAIGSAKRNV